jgi:hypothetical protein
MIFAAFSLADVFYVMNIAEYERFSPNADMLLGEPEAFLAVRV